MTRGPVPFPAPAFRGPAAELAASLALLGVTVCDSAGHRLCVDYEERDGRWVRQVGEVVVHPDGRIVAHPRRDACNRGRIITLRAAELVITEGTGVAGWFDRTAADGGQERYCGVIAYLDDDPPAAAESLAAAQRWSEELALSVQLAMADLAH